jgi:hypothetical protein
MTHKEYLRKVKTLESAMEGRLNIVSWIYDDEEALEAVEKERMKSLEENLDIEWVKSMASEEFDEELEEEYGNLF